MIGIQLDGDQDFLDTQDDTTIDITLDNPIFGDIGVLSPGSFSMPFNLPGGNASPKNSAKLKNPDVVENNEAYFLQKATLFWGQDPVPFKKGYLKSNTMDPKKISSYFLFGLNTVNPELKTARLRDVINENILIDSTAITKKIWVKFTGSGNPSITVNGNTYTDTDLYLIGLQINADANSSANMGKVVPYCSWVTSGPNSPGGLTPSFLVIVPIIITTYYDPVLHLTFIITNAVTDPLVELSAKAEGTGYAFDGFDTSGYYSAFSTFLAGYQSGSYPTDKFRFPVMFNANLYDGESVKETELINGMDGSGLIINDPVKNKNHNSIQPFVMLKWALQKIATHFGFDLEGDFYDDAETANLLIDNSQTLDVLQDYLGPNKFAWWRRSFNLNEFVPDISVVDFLKGIASRYNLAIYQNEITGKVRIQYRQPAALATAYDDITDVCGSVDETDDNRTTGFLLFSKREASDLLSTDETITVGVAQNSYEILCGRLFGLNSLIKGGGVLIGPRTSRKNGVQFGLRVFHYTGLTNNTIYSYPSGSINPASGYLEYLQDGILAQPGLYSTFWKYWLLFEKNRVAIKLTADFPLRSLMKFDWALKRRYNRNNFFMKSIRIAMTNTMMQVNQIELWSVK